MLIGLRRGADQVARFALSLAARSSRRHNGWLVPPPATGDSGAAYLLRAYIAGDALGANVPAEAVYPVTFVDRTGAPLSGRHRYVLHFAAGRLPPVGAFWSLTMYGRELFLVPNRIGRYAVGDRTPGLSRNRDGSLDILLQHSAPQQGVSNWLPSPSGGFALGLRLYQPLRSVLRGSWPLPTVRRVGSPGLAG